MIEQLGHEHYATRKQAEDRLSAIGVPALDQLQEAILHSDPQIANAARYLIRSSFTNWTSENDPVEVQNLLKQYGTSDVRSRDDRIIRLEALNNDRGLPALLRIARFEVSGELSRKAALAILKPRLKPDADKDSPISEAAWQLIYDTASVGKNDACRWLTELAAVYTKQKAFDADFWKNQLAIEQKLFEDESGETNRDTWVDFTRLVVEQLSEHGRMPEALEIAGNLLDIPYTTRERIPKAVDFCLWALDRSLYPLVIRQCEVDWIAERDREENRFIRSDVRPQFDYLRAEAHRKMNEPNEAERYAAQAFNRNDNGTVSADDRTMYGRFLYFRRQYDWAENEFRESLKSEGLLDEQEMQLLVNLIDLLADGAEFDKAAELMKPMVERLESDSAFAKELDADFGLFQNETSADGDDSTFTDRFRANYYFYRAKTLVKNGDLNSAKADFREALRLHPANIDIAIMMWKNRDDEAWNREADKAVDDAVKHFAAILPKLERAVRMYGPNDFATHRKNYANALNTYAWLLVCTDREPENALSLSQQACQLQPDYPAYLDTLARCCFKVGRVEEAVRIQKRAIALEPYTREIARALEEYTAQK